MNYSLTSEPAAMVDLTGLTCPGPILGAREILEGLRDGQVLLLLSDCPGTRDDLFSWARQTNNEVIHTEPRDRGATGYYVRKGRSGTVRGSPDRAPTVVRWAIGTWRRRMTHS